MEIDLTTAVENVVYELFATHSKIKVGKIASIDKEKRLCTIAFFEYVNKNDQNMQLPVQENVPFFYTQYSASGVGILTPYNIGDNVLVAILDNFNFKNFFQTNSKFQVFSPHNLANAVVIGHAPTLANDIEYDGEGVLVTTGNALIEVKKDGKIDIKNNNTSLKDIINQTLIACKNITVTVLGVPVPINNIAEFTAIQTLVTQLFK